LGLYFTYEWVRDFECTRWEKKLNVFVYSGKSEEEPRLPATPQSVKRLKALGADVFFEADFGKVCGWSDAEYVAVGAQSGGDIAGADVVLGMEPPEASLLAGMKPGALYIGYLDPFNSQDLLQEFAARGLSAIAMELIPRTTLAQKMDALSSQANLAGYAAVLLGSSRLAQILPMMMTPAGTIKPARVFVIGVGVAGLQAIATAKRLGARVDAFDTRPVVEEQVKSLGARFVKANLGETGQTKDGYAQALTEEQQAMQRAAMADVVAESNLVITTAQVFGRKAPVIVTDAMIQRMRPGSVIVDVAVDSGGNVEGITPGEITESHGVTLVALPHLAREVPVDASEMYAANLANLIEHFWDRENTMIRLDTSDEIMAGCLVVHNGEIRDERFRK
jgi:NAD(P) transhydrogenase subunit alpha